MKVFRPRRHHVARRLLLSGVLAATTLVAVAVASQATVILRAAATELRPSPAPSSDGSRLPRGPALRVTGLEDVERTPRPVIRISVSSDDLPLRLDLRVDGVVRKTLHPADGSSVRWVRLPRLREGTHVVDLVAPSRTVAESSAPLFVRRFRVDSSEHLGDAVLGPGARGRDVVELQRRLTSEGWYRGSPSGVYDRATTRAVVRLQRTTGMTVDGIAGPRVLGRLLARVIIDLSERRLELYRGNALIRSYPVGVGRSDYPTPQGTFAIVTLQRDPTWYPPDSGWAQGMDPVPPGKDNPLGTRWIGLSASGIGIHGTPEDASVGQAASHGCIRMHTWQVEELFELVRVGMRVVVQA